MQRRSPRRCRRLPCSSRARSVRAARRPVADAAGGTVTRGFARARASVRAAGVRDRAADVPGEAGRVRAIPASSLSAVFSEVALGVRATRAAAVRDSRPRPRVEAVARRPSQRVHAPDADTVRSVTGPDENGCRRAERAVHVPTPVVVRPRGLVRGRNPSTTRPPRPQSPAVSSTSAMMRRPSSTARRCTSSARPTSPMRAASAGGET